MVKHHTIRISNDNCIDTFSFLPVRDQNSVRLASRQFDSNIHMVRRIKKPRMKPVIIENIKGGNIWTALFRRRATRKERNMFKIIDSNPSISMIQISRLMAKHPDLLKKPLYKEIKTRLNTSPISNIGKWCTFEFTKWVGRRQKFSVFIKNVTTQARRLGVKDLHIKVSSWLDEWILTKEMIQRFKKHQFESLTIHIDTYHTEISPVMNIIDMGIPIRLVIHNFLSYGDDHRERFRQSFNLPHVEYEIRKCIVY
jgi:hypothetical protein